MRYKYNLQLFYVVLHRAEGLKPRPAALFTQTDPHFVPKLSDIQVFDTVDGLMTWLMDTDLMTYDQLRRVDTDFRSGNAAQSELFISPLDAARQMPPILPGPGEVVPSEEFIAKFEARESGRKK
jgi:hypothetical protein